MSLAEPRAKLLFDENLAARLVRVLADIYPASAHVGDVGLLGASDREIWRHAFDGEFAIVTKDEDFHRLSLLQGPRPKVIWIGLGNCSTEDVTDCCGIASVRSTISSPIKKPLFSP